MNMNMNMNIKIKSLRRLPGKHLISFI